MRRTSAKVFERYSTVSYALEYQGHKKLVGLINQVANYASASQSFLFLHAAMKPFSGRG